MKHKTAPIASFVYCQKIERLCKTLYINTFLLSDGSIETFFQIFVGKWGNTEFKAETDNFNKAIEIYNSFDVDHY
ncbi:MAG: hypothetical protein ABIP51_16705 [Bacteroidia bacterium]